MFLTSRLQFQPKTGQPRFRKLNAPELLLELAEGAVYINGVKIKKTEQEAA